MTSFATLPQRDDHRQLFTSVYVNSRAAADALLCKSLSVYTSISNKTPLGTSGLRYGYPA